MASSGGRVVMVTGAAGNLGIAVAAAFRRAGDRTVLLDRSLEALRQHHPEDGAEPAQLLIGDLDVTEPAAVGEAVARARQSLGDVEVLVNTVGAFRAGKALHEEDLATWDFLFRINVRTALVAARAVLPGMLERGRGAIVNIASRDALEAPAGAAAYSASKAALVRMTESLAQEVKLHGVTANCVLPGTLDTPQNRASLPESAWATLIAPDAVAQVIAFLASPAGCAVNGAAIPVYGRG